MDGGDGDPAFDRRGRILDAAREAFSTCGFHAASMAEIASGAGVSVGHIYRWFDNKEAVVAAIIEDDLRQATVEIAALDGDPEAIADHILAHLSRCADPPRAALKLEVMAEAARNPQVGERVRAADAELRARLRTGFPQGGPDRPDASARVELACVLIEGMLARACKADPADRASVALRVRALLVEALSA